VRFLGRKVYVGFVVLLKTAMHQGLSRGRIAQLGAVLPGIERRTLERWRRWCRENFAEGPFWKAARARLIPPISAKHLPLRLCESFEIATPERLVDLLRFLSPIITACLNTNPPM
jgi:hypothetical protein